MRETKNGAGSLEILKEKLGEPCQNLLKGWEEALRNTPEFVGAFLSGFFEGSPIMNEVEIPRGGDKYSVYITVGEGYRRFDIQRKGQVNAQTRIHVDLRDGEPVSGWIEHVSYNATGDPICFSNTDAAISEAAQFLEDFKKSPSS